MAAGAMEPVGGRRATAGGAGGKTGPADGKRRRRPGRRPGGRGRQRSWSAAVVVRRAGRKPAAGPIEEAGCGQARFQAGGRGSSGTSVNRINLGSSSARSEARIRARRRRPEPADEDEQRRRIERTMHRRSDDDAWKDREAAVLCVDTIAEGCMTGLRPHLPQIVPLLTLLLDDKYPLVRSITCQTMSRYSKFIVQSDDPEQFVKIMKVLVKRILDANKGVHEAARSAFVTIGKEAAELVGLETVLQHLMLDYEKHQTRDLRLITDTICTLADAVGAKLNEASCLDIIVTPLLMKWQQLQCSDEDLLPLLECFISIAQAVGSEFSRFAEPVFQNCIKFINFQQLATAHPAAPSLIVCSLDLLLGLAEALGAGTESLVGQGNSIEVLMHCCKDEAAGVRQRALTLLGELSRVFHRHPNLQEFLKVAAEQLTWPSVKVATSVANTACWVIRELATKVLDKLLVGNSAITPGRLSLLFPEIVSSHMRRSMQAWCNALCIRTGDNLEREDAFSGLCAVVEANPTRAVGSLSDVCKAFATLKDIQSQELRSKVCHVLNDLKQEHASGCWEQCMDTLDLSEVHRLATLLTAEQQIGQAS